MSKKTIVITAGHSNKDPGAVTVVDGVTITEAEISARFRNALTKKLSDHFNVVTDGTGEVNQTLNDAITLIKRHTPVVAIEIHTNASSNPQAIGVETISLPKDKKLSQGISAAIASVMGERIRGDNGWIDQSQSARGRLGYINAGGIIIETFFLSNHESLRKWLDKYWLVADAVAKYLIEELG